MRIGTAIGPFPEHVEDVPDEFDFVELAIGEMEIDPDEIDREKLQTDLEENDLDLIVHLPFRQPLVTGVEELDEGNIEYMKRLLSFSKEIGAEKAVIHVNNRYGHDQEEKYIEQLEENMRELDAIGNRKEVEVVFENVPETNQEPAMELVDLGRVAEEEDLSLCLDTAHAYADEGQEALEDFIDNHLSQISHLHVQDSIRGEDSHVAVGHGEIDWDEVGSRLSTFEGTVTIEVYSQDMEYQSISRRKFLEFCGQNI